LHGVKGAAQWVEEVKDSIDPELKRVGADMQLLHGSHSPKEEQLHRLMCGTGATAIIHEP